SRADISGVIVVARRQAAVASPSAARASGAGTPGRVGSFISGTPHDAAAKAATTRAAAPPTSVQQKPDDASQLAGGPSRRCRRMSSTRPRSLLRRLLARGFDFL